MTPRILFPLLALPLLAACETMVTPAAAPGAEPPATEAPAAPPEAPEPPPRPPSIDPTPAPPPPPTAVTVEDLDTTTEEDRAEALAAPVSAPAGSLGTTTATLGPPGDPGIWIETPLVSEPTMGRVVYGGTGKSVNLELRPSGGEPGSGSQISLAAIRLLEAPLTGILELQVFGS